MRSFKIDLFSFVAYPVGLYLGYKGLVSWWTLLVIFLTHCEFSYTYKR